MLLLYTYKAFVDDLITFYLDIKMRTTTNTSSNQNSEVTPYKDYPASNSSTKSQAQLVCKKKNV